MKNLFGIAWDYVLNALVSAAIGGLVSVGISLAQSEGLPSPVFGASCALVGVACGTASKLIIEGAFALFGPRRWIAYLLNASVIAGIVVAYVLVFFGTFQDMRVRAILIAFAVPEAASFFIVRAEVEQSIRLERAFKKRHDDLERGAR